jgi:membrane-associated protease RseP (regulator of RpoE activity)
VSQPGSEEDRYAHLELEGKIVVVEAADPHGSGQATLAGDPHFKASVAAGRGAAGVLILLQENVALPDPAHERRPSVRTLAAAVDPDQAEKVREAALAGQEAHLTLSLEPRMLAARNVVGLLPGNDPTLGREVVIVGAHYDHLGLGAEGSLAPDAKEVHNGADDNASGTAALMEVARRMAGAPERPSRSVLFLAFTGEEKGLWGSGHYVEEPLFQLENTTAMINMYMVGRLRENTLTVYGTGTAEEWPTLLEELNERQGEPMVISSIPDGFGPSDQSSFYGKKIPVLHFFTNTHSEYHRPEDDWQLINSEGLARVAGFVEEVTSTLAGVGMEEVVALTLVEGTQDPHGGGMPSDEESAAPSRGYGAYLGTIPDMTPQDFGVRITGVREESPAEQAGLQAGDVIVEFEGREISDLYAYTYALRDHQPGDTVAIVVVREGERVTLTALLGQRR